MPENQIELNNPRKKQLGRCLEATPDLGKFLGPQIQDARKDGAIDSKTKRFLTSRGQVQKTFPRGKQGRSL